MKYHLFTHKKSVTMQEQLDYLDVKILEGMGTYGPRELTSLAKQLDLKRGTVWKRVRHLSSLHLLKLHANVYHTNLGLKKAVVIAWASPGQENLLFDCLSANDYRIYVSRCYGTSEGCVAIYAIPKNNTPDFQEFIDRIQNLGLTTHVQLFWSTCFQSVNPTSNWFDLQSETWVFRWDEWIQELINEGTELPYTLVDPRDFRILGDRTDVFILKELEKDATISFVDIARKLGESRQTIEYHYQNHILKRDLIEDIQVSFAPFDRKGTSEPVFLVLRFPDEERMAKFALSLLDKPFAHTLGKILNEKALVANLHFLSRRDFRGFTDALFKAVRKGFVQNYSYAFLDLERTIRETIRHELFKDDYWIYNHTEYLKRITDLVDNDMEAEKLTSSMRQEKAEKTVSEAPF